MLSYTSLTPVWLHQALVAGLSSVVFPVGDTFTDLTAEGLRVTNGELRHSRFLKLVFFVCLFENQMIKETISGLASLLSSSVRHWNMLLAKLAKII